jgi:signal transduction histidine kinase/DNA-binding response OmpR family regulator
MSAAARQDPQNRPRVLLVEEERTIRKHLSKVLGDEFVIDAAGTGAQALERVLRARPDVVVTDVVMRDLGGIELLRTLRNTPSTRLIPVLLISGPPAESVRIEGLEHGADGYLPKPYTVRELRTRIRTLIHTTRERSEASRREVLEHYRYAFDAAAVCLWEEDLRGVADYVAQLRAAGVKNIREHFGAHPDLVMEAARRMRVCDVNSTTLRIFGAESKESFIASLDKILTDRAFEVFRELLIALAEGYSSFSSDAEIYTLRGELLHFHVTVNFPPLREALDRVLLTMVDITDKKIHEEETRAAAARDAVRVRLADTLRPLTDPAEMESAATRILGEHLAALRVMYVEITPDIEYAIVRANYLSNTARSVIGKHRLDDFGPLSIAEFRAGDTLKVADVAVDPRLDSNARSSAAAIGVGAHLLAPLKQFGRPVAALAVHYGEPHRWNTEEVTFIEEFAERTWVALERARSEREVREANRRKDEFLATLAHELRNPLAPMRSAAQLLKMPGVGESQSHMAREIIERQVRHMVRLIDDLMDVSRITLGQVNLRHERVNLGAVITDALEASRPAIESGGHSLEVHLPPAPLIVEGDGTRLSQVFQNLLNNAAKYTPSGGRITLVLSRQGRQAFVSVRDSGVGIAKEVQERIFDLFTRLDPSESIKVSGLGIGLALAKQLVELHQGRIEVNSEGAGRGSEFTVALPLFEQETLLPIAEGDPTVASLQTPARRVLVVDDNRDAAESLALLLQLCGCEVSVAFNGLDALSIFANSRPEIMLLDIGMPGMDGYEVARRIRSTTAGEDVFLVALTGWGQAEDKRRALQAGFDEHVTKPVDPDRLTTLLTSGTH